MKQQDNWTVLMYKMLYNYTLEKTTTNKVAKIQTLSVNVATSVPASSADACNSACTELLNLSYLRTDTVNHKYVKSSHLLLFL